MLTRFFKYFVFTDITYIEQKKIKIKSIVRHFRVEDSIYHFKVYPTTR